MARMFQIARGLEFSLREADEFEAGPTRRVTVVTREGVYHHGANKLGTGTLSLAMMVIANEN